MGGDKAREQCSRVVQGVAGHCADEDEEDEQQRAASTARTAHGASCASSQVITVEQLPVATERAV